MRVLLQMRWFAILLVLVAACGWATRAMSTGARQGGVVLFAEGGGDGEDGDSGAGIELA